MALSALFPSFLPSSIRHNQPSFSFYRNLRTSSSSSTSSGAQFVTCALKKEDQETGRRSAHWQPSVWDYNFVQSLGVDYNEDEYMEQVQRLKKEVKGLFDREMSQVAKLEFIDVVQRLGLGYHFKTEIKNALGSIYNNTEDAQLSDDLYTVFVRFRLLREHGYKDPQDVFQRFINKNGKFNESLEEDVKGVLGLYEASFHGWEGEAILDEARNFASKHLKDLNLDKVPAILASHVSHALDMPIRWKPNKLEARWFMDMYEKQQDMIPSLLRLAKLDFNLVQSTYKKELSDMASIMAYEPQYTAFRKMNTKIACMIVLIDDVYDVYGTPEELELLTDFIVRWDITNVDRLPPTIRDSFMALYNTTNEIGYWTMRERGINPIPYMRKVLADQCKAYMEEVRWFSKGTKPTLEEYLDVAVNSGGGLIMLLANYFLTTDKLTEEGLDYVSRIPSIMHSSGKILRLINDLNTSSYELARGDNFKALECYMNESGTSEGAAREHISNMVHEHWKMMNGLVFEDYPVPGLESFLSACLNLARVSHVFYQFGDGFGLPSHKTKDHLVSLVYEPVPLD